MFYDIIVVGGGHAGAEAASSAARMGSSVLLITMNLQSIGQMSCNPSIGGIATGQIIREIDALGGFSGILTDHTMIQFRMLNQSKGPAMWSPRAQLDRMRFSENWRFILESIPKISFYQDSVIELLIKKEKVCGVKTALGEEIKSKAVILTNGTFLNGLIHIGEKKISGGRINEKSTTGLSLQLLNLGFEVGRMKTGTSPRIDGRSLNFSKMQEQYGDEDPKRFSFLDTPRIAKQYSCYITYTSEKVHEVLRSGFDRSPMFNGLISSKGPRYCPSIEDKIYRFSNRDRHQIFIEPEGFNTTEVYVNGFSTSLPKEIQFDALQKIIGFEKVKILKPGYAIEYDYFSPLQLHHSLETKKIKNLFFSGQINGTTGYEVAAAQGLIAGLNAHLKINEKAPFVLLRNEAYIGVLIDDLVTKGTEEPYRMFTSRAEYRILLRQDNADERLTQYAVDLGLVENNRLRKLEEKLTKVEKCVNFFNREIIAINKIIQPNKISTLLSRPEFSYEDLFFLAEIKEYGKFNRLKEDEWQQVSVRIKYKSYIERESEIAYNLLRLEKIRLPNLFNYQMIKSLSLEAQEKLNMHSPYSIGQASRISGISPADINTLIIYIKK